LRLQREEEMIVNSLNQQRQLVESLPKLPALRFVPPTEPEPAKEVPAIHPSPKDVSKMLDTQLK
jgi:hypothetical protein